MDLKAAGLIEDFFTVNEERSETFPADTLSTLVEEFCITEAGVFIFNLAVSFSSQGQGGRVPNVEVMLLIDGAVRATAEVNDNQQPSNLKLFYMAVSW